MKLTGLFRLLKKKSQAQEKIKRNKKSGENNNKNLCTKTNFKEQK